MSTVGVKELKNRLTHYLRLTKQGEEVVITDRGEPIAIIQPVQSVKQVRSRDGRLAQLAVQGMLTLPTRQPLQRIRRVKVSGTPISRTILEDRR